MDELIGAVFQIRPQKLTPRVAPYITVTVVDNELNYSRRCLGVMGSLCYVPDTPINGIKCAMTLFSCIFACCNFDARSTYITMNIIFIFT